ncbi:serine/threonine protein kinase [Streptomyces sp. MST-110588]|uniref:serine/threonine protein kinase n=1 Tax=Streptomyces sp. MST-110588 TaxID=2833628 RepID=UPI003242B75F
MHVPRTDVPQRIGPYTVIVGLDDEAGATPMPEKRFIARSADGERTVLVCVPGDGADPGRFLAEAEASRHLLGAWSSPATETSGPGEAPWHARPYVPAIPLPTALAVHGGPLPERTVRALGAALVETLVVGHGQSLVHAGVAPAAVLLTADGPRLTCFGAVRAAAVDGTVRSGLPGLESGSLPPEQAAGGRPDAMGDIYALGATLAYAATGHTVPEREELPAALRAAIARCLSRDPAARPRPAELLEVFSPAQAPGSPAADAHPASRAAAVLGAGWLPARVVAALARQSAAVLAAEIPVPAEDPAAENSAPPPEDPAGQNLSPSAKSPSPTIPDSAPPAAGRPTPPGPPLPSDPPAPASPPKEPLPPASPRTVPLLPQASSPTTPPGPASPPTTPLRLAPAPRQD